MLRMMQHCKQITIAEIDLQDLYLDVVINLCVHASGIMPEMVRLFECVFVCKTKGRKENRILV